MHLMRIIVIILTLMVPSFAAARGGDARRCDLAAAAAAKDTGVPIDVLRAISRVEAGRTIDGAQVAWPWTVNEAGAGAFFASEAEAVAHVAAAMAAGGSNIDIGCFQVNLYWHGRGFSSLQAMFNPDTNARYAAGFLQQLYKELGGWDLAIGAYHSRKSAAASRYLSKVQAVMGQAPAPLRAKRQNRFPLLGGIAVTEAAPAIFGSLFWDDAGADPVPLFW